VREHAGVDPYSLSEEEFVKLLNEALWLVHYRQEMMVSAMELGVLKALAKVLPSK